MDVEGPDEKLVEAELAAERGHLVTEATKFPDAGSEAKAGEEIPGD